MRKTVATLIAAAVMVAPFAHAQGTPITVQLTYDSSLLSSESGAKAVLKSIKKQATEACSYKKPVFGTPSFDRACRAALVEQAISEIRLAALEEGQATTYVFASLD